MNVLSVPHPVFRRIRGGNAFEETVERLLASRQARPGAAGGPASQRARAGVASGDQPGDVARGDPCTRPGGLPGVAPRPVRRDVRPPDGDWRQDTRDVRATAGELDDELTDALLFRQVLEPAAVELAARRAHPAEK